MRIERNKEWEFREIKNESEEEWVRWLKEKGEWEDK